MNAHLLVKTVMAMMRKRVFRDRGCASNLIQRATARTSSPVPPPKDRSVAWPGILRANDLENIRLPGQTGPLMPEFHPILTTDYFEFGTSANRLDREGCAVEMGDAVLGLVASEGADAPSSGTCPTP